MSDYHTQTYQSQEDWEHENLGKGAGDIDVYQPPAGYWTGGGVPPQDDEDEVAPQPENWKPF